MRFTMNGFHRLTKADVPVEDSIHNERAALACEARGDRTDSPLHYTIPQHQALSDLIADLRDGVGAVITPQLLMAAARHRGIEITPDELAVILSAPTTWGLSHYAGEMEARHQRLALEKLAGSIQTALLARESPAEIAERITTITSSMVRPRVATFTPISAGKLVDDFPCLRPPIIDGIIRAGETVELNAKAKAGKSWMAYAINLSIASGYFWLGRFRCEQGKVLLLDYELHKESLASRIATVANAMHLHPDDWRDTFEVIPLRGSVGDISQLRDIIRSLERNTYRLITIDPLYRLLGADTSENDNAAMARLLTEIQNYCDSTGAGQLLIHHQSKGGQSDKDVSDVGSGAGSIGRAVDGKLILRAHDDESCVVLDAVLRSFAPISPAVLRWEYPLWRIDDEADPAHLKRPAGAGQAKQDANDREGKATILTKLREHGGMTDSQLRRKAGMGLDRVRRLLRIMEADNSVKISDQNDVVFVEVV